MREVKRSQLSVGLDHNAAVPSVSVRPRLKKLQFTFGDTPALKRAADDVESHKEAPEYDRGIAELGIALDRQFKWAVPRFLIPMQ